MSWVPGGRLCPWRSVKQGVAHDHRRGTSAGGEFLRHSPAALFTSVVTRHPRCRSPPSRLPDLPEGEAVREWPVEIWGGTHPFSAAACSGLLQRPAPSAQRPAPRAPPATRTDRPAAAGPWVVVVGPGAVGARAVPGALRRHDRAHQQRRARLAGCPLIAAPFVGGVWLLVSTGGRDVVEFGAGYTCGLTWGCGGWRRTAACCANLTGRCPRRAGTPPRTTRACCSAGTDRAGSPCRSTGGGTSRRTSARPNGRSCSWRGAAGPLPPTWAAARSESCGRHEPASTESTIQRKFCQWLKLTQRSTWTLARHRHHDALRPQRGRP